MSCDSQCSVALPRGFVVSLQCIIVVFPDHAHLLFWDSSLENNDFYQSLYVLTTSLCKFRLKHSINICLFVIIYNHFPSLFLIKASKKCKMEHYERTFHVTSFII